MVPTKKLPMVYIIILNWNGREDTLSCIESVYRISYPNFQLIVADNGSSDGSLAAIQARFPNVYIVENKENLGFAEGNNRAIIQALEVKADFILLLNNDTVVDPNILSAFLSSADAVPYASIFGPKIYYFDKNETIWYAGGYWDENTLSFNEYGAKEFDQGQFDKPTETDWVIGCAMFIRAELFKEIGLLDSKYFLNNEEIDFCIRARKAGHAIYYTPTAKLWHKVSVSFGGDDSPLKIYFSTRNRLLLAKKNMSFILRIRIYIRMFSFVSRLFIRPVYVTITNKKVSFKECWWMLFDALQDKRNRAALIGIRDFMFNRFGNCPDGIRSLNETWKSQLNSRNKKK